MIMQWFKSMQLSIGTVSVTKLAWLQIHCCFAEKGDCTAQTSRYFSYLQTWYWTEVSHLELDCRRWRRFYDPIAALYRKHLREPMDMWTNWTERSREFLIDIWMVKCKGYPLVEKGQSRIYSGLGLYLISDESCMRCG